MDCSTFTTDTARPSAAISAASVAIPAMLPALNLDGLTAYYDAIVAACDGVVGILNQPRVYGVAEKLLSDRCETLDLECQTVADMIRRYTPEDDVERRKRAYFLIAYECRCGESVAKIAALAAALAVKDRN